MNRTSKETAFANLEELAAHLREVLEEEHFILIFGHNGTGKTRLSMAFKTMGKSEMLTLARTNVTLCILTLLPVTCFGGTMTWNMVPIAN